MQTQYLTQLPQAYAGMPADGGPHDVTTGLNDMTVAIPFGLGMVYNGTYRHYRLPAASSDKISGISGFTQSVNTIGSTMWPPTAGIPPGDVVNLYEHGRLYVIPETSVVENQAVYCRFAFGSQAANAQPGAFRGDADVVASWASSTGVLAGTQVVNGGQLYQCTKAGTTAGSGGPTGTGSGIVDGTANWAWIAAQAAGASAVLVPGALFASPSTAPGGLSIIAFDKLINI